MKFLQFILFGPFCLLAPSRFWAGAGAAIAGSLIGGAGSAFGASQANAFSERAYKHRHQWEVADLRKAGLNPILSAKFGGGGSPSGQGFNVPAPDFNSARLVSRQLDLIRAQEKSANATAMHQQSQTTATDINNSLNLLAAKKIVTDPTLINRYAAKLAGASSAGGDIWGLGSGVLENIGAIGSFLSNSAKNLKK